jgi:uncharacterized protein
VADVAAATRFYGDLFGWTFVEAAPGSERRYLAAQLDGQDAAGIGQASATTDSPTWNTYIAVADIDQAAARLQAAGGRIMEPSSYFADAALTASCVDIEGIPFRLWQAKGRLGAQVANTPGAWNFSDLHTTDPETALAFYARVFGWRFDDLGFAIMICQPGYGDHLAATSDPGIHERQSGDQVPPGFADAFG